MSINGKPLTIDRSVLETARFIAGAHRLVTKDGNQLSGLSLQRKDISHAIATLKAARIKL